MTASLLVLAAAGCDLTSVTSEDQESPYLGGPVTFFEHVAFEGNSLAADRSVDWVGDAWNDNISSVLVPEGARLVLFEHARYEGDRLELVAPGVVDLRDFGWNDRASSFTIEGGGEVPPGGPVTRTGRFTELRDFPPEFFAGMVVPLDDLVPALDEGYLILGELSSNLFPMPQGPVVGPAFQSIVYDDPVYGVNGFPMKLGRYAAPAANGGDPRWAVIFHEMGHNFWNDIQWFYTLAAPGPFLQEASAVLSAEFVFRYFAYNGRGVSGAALASMARDGARERAMIQNALATYIARGRVYQHMEVLTSQALDAKLFQAGDLYGWHNFARFKQAFSNDVMPHVSFHHDGVDELEETTYMVAAVSVAFDRDFRADFRALNFPIDDGLYASFCNVIKQRAVPSAIDCFAGPVGPQLP